MGNLVAIEPEDDAIEAVVPPPEDDVSGFPTISLDEPVIEELASVPPSAADGLRALKQRRDDSAEQALRVGATLETTTLMDLATEPATVRERPEAPPGFDSGSPNPDYVDPPIESLQSSN